MGLFEKVQTIKRYLESNVSHLEEWCNNIRAMAMSKPQSVSRYQHEKQPLEKAPDQDKSKVQESQSSNQNAAFHQSSTYDN